MHLHGAAFISGSVRWGESERRGDGGGLWVESHLTSLILEPRQKSTPCCFALRAHAMPHLFIAHEGTHTQQGLPASNMSRFRVAQSINVLFEIKSYVGMLMCDILVLTRNEKKNEYIFRAKYWPFFTCIAPKYTNNPITTIELIEILQAASENNWSFFLLSVKTKHLCITICKYRM